MIIFRVAHYAADGMLVRASEAFPVDDPPDPQTAADLCARAAEAGCTYEAGTFLVWIDRHVQPHERIEGTPKADGLRSYGGQDPPVPTYRWQRRADSSILLIPAASASRAASSDTFVGTGVWSAGALR